MPTMEEASNPYPLFTEWLETAKREKSIPEPTAMALGTVDGQGQPHVRIVLLKSHDDQGFVFYTNLTSHKGEQLIKQPRAALNFYWGPLSRQVRIIGNVVRVRDEEADAYYATRPEGSKLGAWGSKQSQPLESRKQLEEEIHKVEAEYAGKEVPRPPFWSGFRVVPQNIEFWEERPFRLHDRFVFEKQQDGSWSKQRLYP